MGCATVPSVCKSPQTSVNFDQTLRPPFLFSSLPSFLPPSPASLSTMCSAITVAPELFVRAAYYLAGATCSLEELPRMSHHTRTHTFSAPVRPNTLTVAPLPSTTPTHTISEHLRPRWTPATDGDTHTRAHKLPPQTAKALHQQGPVWGMGNGHAFVQRLGTLQAHTLVYGPHTAAIVSSIWEG